MLASELKKKIGFMPFCPASCRVDTQRDSEGAGSRPIEHLPFPEIHNVRQFNEPPVR